MTAALVVFAILVIVLGVGGALLIRRHHHHLRHQPIDQPTVSPPAPPVHRMNGHPRR